MAGRWAKFDTSTCTHLNDTLRTLADIEYLLDLTAPGSDRDAPTGAPHA